MVLLVGVDLVEFFEYEHALVEEVEEDFGAVEMAEGFLFDEVEEGIVCAGVVV